MRKVYRSLLDIKAGSKILGIRVQEPVAVIYNPEKDIVYPSDNECIMSDTKLVYVEITDEERLQCHTQIDIDNLARKLSIEVAQQLNIKHYKVT